MTLLGPSAPGMAFMMKKKKYKFNVEVQLEELVEVALVNEVLFAKIRLLDGGSFQEYSNREEVKNHTVKWNKNFEFLCKMSANASTGVLDPCFLRVSIRKELKGGRSYYKLGFIDVNLAEFAGSGLQSRRFLLEGYDQRHRLDNSMLRISIKLHMLSGDILFKAPSPNLKSKQIPSQEELGSIASSGGGSGGGGGGGGVGGVGSGNSGIIGGGNSPPSLTGLQTPTGTIAPIIGIPPSVITSSNSGILINNSGNSNNSCNNVIGISAGNNRSITSTQIRDLDNITGNYSGLIINTNTSTSQASSGFGSLTKNNKKLSNSNDIYYSSDMDPNAMIASIITDSGLSESSDPTITSDSIQSYPPPSLSSLSNNAQQVLPTGVNSGIGGNSQNVGSIIELGHSRNSSNTSQMSKGSGYSSFSHSQHSRQSSEGDSGHARYQKSISILSKLNQRALNAMKLNIPLVLHHNNVISTTITTSATTTTLIQSPTTCKRQLSATIDTDGNVYLTPNCSLLTTNQQDQSIDDYRTPLTEMPLSCKYLHTPPTTATNLTSLLEMSGDDSGLDETYHTPQLTTSKTKSMENLAFLEMEFRKSTQNGGYIDQYSPRRLGINMKLPKIRSLNNLFVAELDDEQQEEQEQQQQQQQHNTKKPINENIVNNDKDIFKSPFTNGTKLNGKYLKKHNKIGNAKFIGIDECPTPPIHDITIKKSRYPIAKVKSVSQIPDIINERVKYDPFLTPITIRKSFTEYQNDFAIATSPITNTTNHINSNFHINNNCDNDLNDIDYSILRSQQHQQLEINQDRKKSLSLNPTSFERGYRKSYQINGNPILLSTNSNKSDIGRVNSSTPLRQSDKFGYFGGGGVCNNNRNGLERCGQDGRPKSTSIQQELLRSISGVPRRLLDNTNRQISSMSTTISPNASSTTLGSLNSNSSFYGGGGINNCNSGSGNNITVSCTSPSPTETSNNNNNNNCNNNGATGLNSSSPTDCHSLISNPSSISSLILINTTTSTGNSGSGCGGSGDYSNCISLSPLGPSSQQAIRRPSINMNPSSGSLVISETGSLDRMKTAAEKRKKAALDDGAPRVSDRVEETRVNPDSLIDEILNHTKLDQLEESAETSGLQLYIARDGTASLGSHEVKSRVSAGAFKQVVMETPR